MFWSCQACKVSDCISILFLSCWQFDEYCEVMEGVGLGVSELGVQALKTLYRIADKDGNGNIDFNEFLVAVVGNLVSI